jgi:preprotein translocase subunit SecG
VIGTILTILYVIACIVLILFVLLQPGKSDASAVFGGGVNSAAFGPRGTQTVLAKITITAAIVFFLIAFLFNTGLFETTSEGERLGNEPAPVQPAPVQPAAPQNAPVTPDAQPGAQPGATPVQPQGQTPPPAPPGQQPAPPGGENK